MTAAPHSPDQWIATFLDAQAAELGASRNTLLAYGRDLKDYVGWLDRADQQIGTIDKIGIEAYLMDCDAQGLATSTRARRLSALKQLYRFAFEEGWRAENPAIQIRGPGRQKQLPKTLEVLEVDRLLNAARQTGSLLGVAAAGAVVTVVPGLAHAAPMVFGLMTLSYAGAMAMAWISRRPAATALAA